MKPILPAATKSSPQNLHAVKFHQDDNAFQIIPLGAQASARETREWTWLGTFPSLTMAREFVNACLKQFPTAKIVT